MRGFAPSGTFPKLDELLIRCLSGQPDPTEVAREVKRQIVRFEEGTGHKPDFIDGHQHVHAFPGIRNGFLRALLTLFPNKRLLVRDPVDRFLAILSRGRAVAKTLSLSVLAAGFGARVRQAGFLTNFGFSGVSTFDATVAYAEEFGSYFRHTGLRHLIMCHPGYPDAELERLDPLGARRRDELDFILVAPGLRENIWHMTRDASDRPLWPG